MSTAVDTAEWARLAELVEGPIRTRDRRHRELDELFREASTPVVERGSYRGVLSGAFHPLVDALGAGFKRLWMPWVGKHLEPSEERGYNLLKPGADTVLGQFLGSSPTYPCGRLTAGYEFGYRLGPSALDDGRQVGRIEYADVVTNPDFLRRMHDELVQVVPGVLLGRFVVNRDEPRVTAWFALHGPVMAPRVERVRAV